MAFVKYYPSFAGQRKLGNTRQNSVKHACSKCFNIRLLRKLYLLLEKVIFGSWLRLSNTGNNYNTNKLPSIQLDIIQIYFQLSISLGSLRSIAPAI